MHDDLLIHKTNQEKIEHIDLKTALEERYLSYALSTIMNRALPDVRDGLKPVHRRIIHAMRQLRLNPRQPMAKCARIVGEVMGKFHPHGDQSIYDALARLAQDFMMRYPLIDGQGNFGNIDGDNPAAMRYTEARMTDICVTLLEGISEDAVDFRATYNEEEEEPIVLPAAFPNLLANGSSGIAVGMATSIPPHNIHELCNAAVHLIKHPNAELEDLMYDSKNTQTKGMIQGPDFPTGGIIVENHEAITKAYKIGKGNIRVRARWNVEEQLRGTYQIVVTEIPYGVQKAKLFEKIAELLSERKLPFLEDVRDESTEEIRLVFIPKNRSVKPEILMESLFRQTDLESRFFINMNVLSYGKIPNVLPLHEILKQWLAHRCQVLLRRSQQRLNEIERSLEILSGHLIACMHIDEVILIIREEDEPKPVLMKRWLLTDLQAESILDLRLRQLRKLEEIEIKEKYEALKTEKNDISVLLSDEKRQWKVIEEEIIKMQKMFGANTTIGKRRTTFEDLPMHNDLDLHEAMIEKELLTVLISKKGWIRTVKGHIQDVSLISFKEDDSLNFFLHTVKTDKIILFTINGKFYTLDVARLSGGRGHGEAIRILLDIEKDDHILHAFVFDPSKKVLLVSRHGYGFIVKQEDIIANTRKGKQIMSVKEPDQAFLCSLAEGDSIAILGENKKMLIFSIEEIPVMSRGKGIKLQKYQDQHQTIKNIKVFFKEDGLELKNSQGTLVHKKKETLKEWEGKRAQVGRLVSRGFSL